MSITISVPLMCRATGVLVVVGDDLAAIGDAHAADRDPEPSRSARSPDLPTAMTIRPQLASSPAIAVLTSGELATARPILRAAPFDGRRRH